MRDQAVTNVPTAYSSTPPLHRFTRSEPVREKAPHLSARLSGWLVKGAVTLCQFLMGAGADRQEPAARDPSAPQPQPRRSVLNMETPLLPVIGG
jgi:hypothetical protein